MRYHHLILITLLCSLTLLAAACGQRAEPTPAEIVEQVSAPTMTAEPPSEPTATIDYARQLEDFNPANFSDPTLIDNPWMPLKPGTQYIYEGATEEGGETKEHRVIITVTDLHKEIDGVISIVTWDEDYSGGDLVETELAFYAQDDEGNVWRMGEYPEVYENDKLVEVPAWISGLKGALAGIMMAADPQPDTRSFSQGWGPAVGFTDRWQVDEIGRQLCVPVDCYADVLVIAEFSQEEPDAFQLKFYAPDVGNIHVDWRGLDATRETLDLVEIVQLDAEALAEARSQALIMEQRAYQISKEVYDQTQPSYVP
jgi:hypothetical protein